MRKITFYLSFAFLGLSLSAFVAFAEKPSISNVQERPVNYKYIENELLYTDLEFFDGSSVTLTDILKDDKAILLDFWYLSCFPCLKAIPHVIELQEKYKDNLTVIGINDIDTPEMINRFFTAKEANYLSTFKTEVNHTKNAKVTAVPTMVLINSQGQIIDVFNG